MFWSFLLVASLAAALVELGAASTTVSILTIGLQVSALIIAILAVLLLWKSYVSDQEPRLASA